MHIDAVERIIVESEYHNQNIEVWKMRFQTERYVYIDFYIICTSEGRTFVTKLEIFCA